MSDASVLMVSTQPELHSFFFFFLPQEETSTAGQVFHNAALIFEHYRQKFLHIAPLLLIIINMIRVPLWQHAVIHYNWSPFLSFYYFALSSSWSVQQEVDADPGVHSQVGQSQFQMCQWLRCCQLPVTAWVERPRSLSQNHLCLLSGNRSSRTLEMLCQALSAHIYHCDYYIVIVIITQIHVLAIWF